MSQENEKKPRHKLCLCGEFALTLSGFFISLGVLHVPSNSFEYISDSYLLIAGLLLAWAAFMLAPRFRLLVSIIGIMGFNVWLIILGIDKISSLQKPPAKETVFIIAVAIIAWLAISCYVLSILKETKFDED